jgi:hypothetical protein
LFPALPGVTDGFKLVAFVSERSLILGWRAGDGHLLVTWSFVLCEIAQRRTRLITRVRGAADYRFRGLPPRVSRYLARPVHVIMQRKQLHELARRIEACPPSRRAVNRRGRKPA